MSRAGAILRVIGGLIALAVVVGVVILVWPAPVPAKLAPRAESAELLARGQYLTTAADCIACHSVPGQAVFAGGREFKLPFGTIYSPNITPDRDTGIGNWSDGEFLRAMHDGVGRGGEELYPAFPYTSYTGMSADDVLAIKSYLFSLAPVRNEVRKNALGFPFNQRPLMRFWKTLFLRRERFKPAPGKSEQWNRGAYLVTSVGHCGECHTPRNFLYGKSGQALAGETMQGWTAWNITSDRAHGIGAWSEQDLVDYLQRGYARGRGVASGPMKEAVDASLGKLTSDDLQAMAIYLKMVPAASTGPVAASRAALAEMHTGPRDAPHGNTLGLRVFEGACASCHTWNGQGAQSPAAELLGRRSVGDAQGVNVVQTILHGGETGGAATTAFMPAFGRAYTDAEIAAAANFTIEYFSGVTGKVAPATVARARGD